MKLDKRVSNLEAKEIGNAPMKVHVLDRSEGTREEAIAAYGLGPNDLIIEIVGFSEVDKDVELDYSHGRDQGGHDETR